MKKYLTIALLLAGIAGRGQTEPFRHHSDSSVPAFPHKTVMGITFHHTGLPEHEGQWQLLLLIDSLRKRIEALEALPALIIDTGTRWYKFPALPGGTIVLDTSATWHPVATIEWSKFIHYADTVRWHPLYVDSGMAMQARLHQSIHTKKPEK